MKITEDDLYKEGIFRTRGNPDGSGQCPAVVVSIERDKSTYPIIAIIHKISGHSHMSCTHVGKLYASHITEHDLIRITPYDHIKKYDPVVVWDSGDDSKDLMMFSHVDEDGAPRVFVNCEQKGTIIYHNCTLLVDYLKKTARV